MPLSDMTADNRYPGVLGPWPPSGPAPLLDPAQGRMQGLLPAPQPTMGLLNVPGDPSSLFGQPFDPMQAISGGQGVASPASPLDPAGWLQTLQALHTSLGGSPSQLTMLGADPPSGVNASAGTDAMAVRPPPAPVASNAVVAAPTLDGSELLPFDPDKGATKFAPARSVQVQVASPHAGDYPTNDAAARAMALDIPKYTPNEYATWFTKKEIPITFPDIGKGPVPFLLDSFNYPGLVTSNNPDDAVLGAPPSGVIGWGHNHPADDGADEKTDRLNRFPSPVGNAGSRGDWYWADQLQKTTPDFQTYILGPDGVLRRFHNNDHDGVDLK